MGLAGLTGLTGLTTGCATRGTAVRELASQDLACPPSAVRVKHEEGHIFRATGCGESVRIACYDPYESTGAAKGVFDGATAGNRVRCEKVLDAAPRAATRTTTTSAEPPAPTPSPSADVFDRALAARLVGASVDRARSCGEPGEEGIARGRARITFSPDGSISAIDIEPPLRDTEIGRCVKRELSRVSLPPFSGSPVTVTKTFEIKGARATGPTT